MSDGGPMLSSSFVIVLTPAQLEELEQLANSRTAAFGWVQRAQAMPAAASGCPNAVIARRLGRHVDTVRRLRKRFAAEGLAALSDRPRPLGVPGSPRRTG
ncbi:helix-turn-helix domain-containing protein [Streptomyces sp. NPDC002668]|uniref:helix-turn-helix domain-containing protein n=1 Tax=Streptomyces sp. NPDC002668 TaxID=3154422 RepID=UPI003331E5DF